MVDLLSMQPEPLRQFIYGSDFGRLRLHNTPLKYRYYGSGNGGEAQFGKKCLKPEACANRTKIICTGSKLVLKKVCIRCICINEFSFSAMGKNVGGHFLMFMPANLCLQIIKLSLSTMCTHQVFNCTLSSNFVFGHVKYVIGKLILIH